MSLARLRALLDGIYSDIGFQTDESVRAKADEALKLVSVAFDLLAACRIAAKAELYDPSTGIIDADVLEIVQDVARAAVAKAETP